jgi:acyl-CoA dehydrogenase
MQNSWELFFDNFPSPAIGWIMKKWIFPWGRSYRYPSDKKSTLLTQALLNNTQIRDKLTEFFYLGDEHQSVGIVESAMLHELQFAVPLNKINTAARERKLNGAITLQERIESAHRQQLISDEELAQLTLYAGIYAKAIAVDDFNTPALV